MSEVSSVVSMVSNEVSVMTLKTWFWLTFSVTPYIHRPVARLSPRSGTQRRKSPSDCPEKKTPDYCLLPTSANQRVEWCLKCVTNLHPTWPPRKCPLCCSLLALADFLQMFIVQLQPTSICVWSIAMSSHQWINCPEKTTIAVITRDAREMLLWDKLSISQFLKFWNDLGEDVGLSWRLIRIACSRQSVSNALAAFELGFDSWWNLILVEFTQLIHTILRALLLFATIF